MASYFSFLTRPPAALPPVVDSLAPPGIEAIWDVFEGKNVDPMLFKASLVKLYGNDLVERSVPPLPKKLDRRDALEVLCHIGNSITIQDLQDAWLQLRRNEIRSEILTFADIDPHECDFPVLGKDMDNLLNLPFPAQKKVLKKLLDLYQNPMRKFEPGKRTLWEEFERSSRGLDKTNFAYIRYHDFCQMLIERSMGLAADVKEKTPEEAILERAERLMAAPEQRSKLIAYGKPETIHLGMVIPVFRPEVNQVFYYELTGKINKDGLHAYLFTPINRPGAPAQLIFRGTKGINSAQSDLDGSGIGKTRFEALTPDLLKMLAPYVQEMGQQSCLEIMGHSLGAADAQRAAALLVDLAVKKECPFNEIKVFAYSSPKLDAATCETWKKNLHVLADDGREGVPQIELNFAHHVSDVVTWTGDFNLCGANAKFINASHLLVKSDISAFKTHDHHTSRFFNTEGSFDFRDGERTFIFYQDEVQRVTEAKLTQLMDASIPVVPEDAIHISDAESELIKNLESMEKHKAEVDASQKGSAQHSWAVWTVSQVAGRPIKGFAYYSISLLQTVKSPNSCIVS